MKELIQSKNFCIQQFIIKECVKQKLTINEFLLILYFINSDQKTFDINIIKKHIFLDDNDILEAFNTLTTKKLISLKVSEDSNKRMQEMISLDELYQKVVTDIHLEEKNTQKETIYDVFQRELGKELSPMEYEIINAWLDNNTSEEMILGALKEAIYNGVKNFRYIDKIIYEWNKKGFKNMQDVKNHLKNQTKVIKQEELFDYDWLANDDEV